MLTYYDRLADRRWSPEALPPASLCGERYEGGGSNISSDLSAYLLRDEDMMYVT